jgi:hypothetical protein
MAFDLNSISRSLAKPARLIVYGVPGVGKTTLAAGAPSPIFIPVEDGLAGQDVPSFPKCDSLDDVRQAMGTLISEDHDFKTVVLDSADVLEPMIWDAVCTEGGKASIGDYAYGRGYELALGKWRDLLRGMDLLRDKGMTVVLLAHSTVVRFEAPDSDGYDRYAMRLHKKANACLHDWADAVLFAAHETRVVSSSGDRKHCGAGGVAREEPLRLRADDRPHLGGGGREAAVGLVSRFEQLGSSVGRLTDEKQAAYGDSHGRACDILRVLFPDGVKPEHYVDLLTITRVLDKLFRLATDPTYGGESPWRDIAGYALLGLSRTTV